MPITHDITLWVYNIVYFHAYKCCEIHVKRIFAKFNQRELGLKVRNKGYLLYIRGFNPMVLNRPTF